MRQTYSEKFLGNALLLEMKRTRFGTKSSTSSLLQAAGGEGSGARKWIPEAGQCGGCRGYFSLKCWLATMACSMTRMLKWFCLPRVIIQSARASSLKP
ncbi:MAG: hypothetical protein RLZZ399_2862 [Verrucomicrobiota bacterium]